VPQPAGEEGAAARRAARALRRGGRRRGRAGARCHRASGAAQPPERVTRRPRDPAAPDGGSPSNDPRTPMTALPSRLVVLLLALGVALGCRAQGPPSDVLPLTDGLAAGSGLRAPSPYTEGTPSRDGTGRFYMGREIAQVMGHRGAAWLERPERERTELPDLVVAHLGLEPDDVVADIGAGTGYFTFRLAPY